jgi:hypothetical protein
MTDTFRLRAEALEWREVDGEIVALIKESSTYIAINSSGAVIWPALAEGATRDALIARLEAEFEIDADQAATDVDAFVAALGEQGLLQPDPAPA